MLCSTRRPSSSRRLARQVRTNVAALSEAIAVENLDALRFGLALHLGEVLYGNIGGGNRLDFTCIGPAVNLAARIEKLTGQLGRVILASEDFARHCPQEFSAIGRFNLAGFGAPQLVFGINEEA
jgi:adenylate cyclase